MLVAVYFILLKLALIVALRCCFPAPDDAAAWPIVSPWACTKQSPAFYVPAG